MLYLFIFASFFSIAMLIRQVYRVRNAATPMVEHVALSAVFRPLIEEYRAMLMAHLISFGRKLYPYLVKTFGVLFSYGYRASVRIGDFFHALADAIRGKRVLLSRQAEASSFLKHIANHKKELSASTR